MKRLAAYIIFNLIITLGIGQGIIIDHTCIDVSQIPSSVIQDIRNNINFQTCGQSHSNQVPCGLDVLETSYPQFDVTIQELVLPTTPNSMSVYVGNQGYNSPGQCCSSIVPWGYWQAGNGLPGGGAPPGQGGAEWTYDCLNYNPSLNVSMFMWCAQMES